MCQVHTGAYVSLLTPGEIDYTACHPRQTTTYTLHVYIYHYAYARQTQVNWKKETKNKERKGKEMGAWGQEKEKKNKFWGVYWRGCHQNGMSHVTWSFDGLQQ